MKTSKKTGFTMIELIFVIVILGILAAVAIPKLTATRDDAKVSKMSTNLNTVISDLGSRYTSKGTLDTWKNSTNVPLKLDATNYVASNTAVTTPAYLYNGDAQCIKFVSTTDGNLTISAGSNTDDTVCKGVQDSQSKNLKSHIFGGTRVVY
ncbi:type II secretion system GspH family protein [Sulfurimonas sp. SWIR-19]|uniref:type II secretion system protein n=1 Tax=Sulfurimonas sp. SWIR-19 TaxID=2878390 RepID=UPI001CF276E8|nr:type II secretion system protein [Sulfurimonas sp. SWIR-19]UCM99204.1 type II secretion system GspH family protein [Sulfurimonas sp. SWIR-19]